ncbi:hypothetical protein ABW19_dt0207123 [Dactylella cylindrospora]|nr:hypothetical protein ABW19_dt0207123 [Dactylella cylindrospora]
MLAVHELGQSHGQSAWQWLGIAVRMCQLLNLPPRTPDLVKGWIPEESERRTWWAVVMLDRMLSSTGGNVGRSFAYGWDRVQGVPLPCSERSWLFSQRIIAGVLDTPIWATAGPTPFISESAPGQLRNGIAISPETGETIVIPKEEESIHARLIRLVDIYGRVVVYLCNPHTSLSSLDTLCQELERWRSELPRSLAYSLINLRAHISERSQSSSYALLHIFYFLSILLLHREALPVLPPVNTTPSPPNKCFAAARSITEIAKEMYKWRSLPLTPIICFAIYSTAWVGTYGLHYPHMTGPLGNGMGSGDARFLLYRIESWRTKWQVADGWVRALGSLHSFLRRKRKAAEIADMASSRKRRRSVGSDDIALVEPRPATPGTEDSTASHSEEMKIFNKTITDFLTLSLAGNPSRDGSHRQPKRSKNHIGASAGGGSDTEMSNAPATSTAPVSTTNTSTSNPAPGDSWVAVNTLNRQDPGRLLGLLAAAQAGEPMQAADSNQAPQSIPSNWNAPDVTTPRRTTPPSLSEIVSPAEPVSAKTEHSASGSLPHSLTPQPSKPIDLNGSDSLAVQSPSHPTKTGVSIGGRDIISKASTPSEFSDLHEKDVILFEEWGPLGLAKVDLAGFCEGKPWREWACGEPSWFDAGSDRLVDTEAD